MEHFGKNISEFEEPFFEIDWSQDEYKNLNFILQIWMNLLTVTKTIFCIISLAAISLLINSFKKCPKFRQGHQIYLLHFGLINYFFMSISIIVYFIVLLIDFHTMSYRVFCLLYTMGQGISVMVTHSFILLYALDYYFYNIKQNFIVKHALFQKFNLTIAYGISIVMFILLILSCTYYRYFTIVRNVGRVIDILYVLGLVGTGILWLKVKYSSSNCDVSPIKISFLTQLIWFPSVSLYFLLHLQIKYVVFFGLTFTAFDSFIFLSPTILVYLLYKYNPEFYETFKTFANQLKDKRFSEDFDPSSDTACIL